MRRTALLLALTALSAPALAAPPKAPSAAAEAQVLELSKQSIALRSVQGPGNKTADVAKLYKQALLGAGWSEKDIEITPVDDTAYLVATWQGSDPKLKPLVISGHMDVVEANPQDWTRDPFTPVVENGYLYGRGASDQKFSEVLAMVGLMELRKGGYKPKRTIIIAFSGDEETTMKTGRILAERFAHAEMVLNTDGSGGALDEATGKPLYWTWDGGESWVRIDLDELTGGVDPVPPEDRFRATMARQ